MTWRISSEVPALRSCFLAALILLIGVPLVSQVEAWRSDLGIIDEQLRAGEYRSAKKRATKLTKKMIDDLGTGDSAAYTLSVTVAFRAIAEAGLGNHEEARWYWWTAYNLFNDITKTDLSPYGEAGRFLSDLQFRDRTDREPLLAPWEIENDQFRRPEILKRPRLVYPDQSRLMSISDKFVFQVVVELDGTPSDPLLLRGEQSKVPAMVFETLDNLKDFEFEPAMHRGKPVPALFNLSVNFRAE